ncbi:MAG: hypothetical protein R2831_06120 [Chitinophagaceae bacterium]
MKHLLSIILLVAFFSSAQSQVLRKQKVYYKDPNFYTSTGVEGSLLQFAKFSILNKEYSTVPRYTYYFNMGVDFNYKLGQHASVFTGLNLKNIGLIVKYNDSVKNKHRVYTVGAPFGLKIHSANRRVSFKTGVDMSFAVDYKWKKFVGDTKVKDHQFFSSRTNIWMPSYFAGININGFSITANSYWCNFFNPNHAANYNYEARLFTLGLGLDFSSLGKRKPKIKVNKDTVESVNDAIDE